MRRIAALFLTLVLLFALTVPAFAAGSRFSDYSEIQNRNAVTLLVDLGLISGDNNGRFLPRASISRAEAAKLLALLCTDTPKARGYTWFADLEGCWAEDFIRFCAAEGIITGDGRGNFRPNDKVTGRELAKMLLVVVGNDASRYGGSSWADHVDQDAQEQGLYARFDRDPGQEISRDNACLLIYNAMQCRAIADQGRDGQPVYYLDDLMNPLTFLEVRFGVVRYTGVLTGNAHADMTASGSLDRGVTKIAGHKEFAVETDLSLLGASVDVYVRDGQVVGTPCPSPNAVSYTFKSKAEMEELCGITGYSVSSEAAYYLNYRASGPNALDARGPVVELVALDQNGDRVFEQVSVVTYSTGTVERSEPLTVRVGGATASAEPIQTGDRFEEGQEVLCVQVGGSWYVK